jgi:hypothetical protein
MNPIRHIRRLTAALAGLACGWLGLAVAAPAAFALPVPPSGGSGATSPPEPPGWNKHPPLPPAHIHQPVHVPVHTIAIGGMPGWQIALIAIGAALFAASAAVLLDRARTARRKSATAGRLSHAR